MKFTAPHFQDADSACIYVEGLRWPDGRVCPKCGGLKSYETTRAGRYRCGVKGCRKDFTVTTGTVMESSHIQLHVWLMAFYMMAASKKGVSAHQLHRSLDLTYKSAWFLCHRIRAAKAAGGMLPPMGGAGQIVEADETYYGKTEERRTESLRGKPYKGKGGGPANKRAVVALVERGGSARTFHVAQADKETVSKIVRENVDPASRLHTDESRLYVGADAHTATHETVKHSAGEYARGDVNTNSAEGFFGVFKKGMRGVYQHCGEKHLHRYLTEFEFRFNNRTALGVDDTTRAQRAIQGAEGKRLTYRRTNGAAAQA
jgi:transposase-like protein